MISKRALLASSALIFAGAASVDAGEVYFTAFGGANWQQGASGFQAIGPGATFGTTGYHFDMDTGVVFGAAVGLHLDRWTMPGLRGEIEASYRRNDIAGNYFNTTFFGPSAGVIEGDVSTFAVSANVWYDIDVGQRWTPYIGGGVGWARTDVKGSFVEVVPGSSVSSFDGHKSGFAWQLGAGVNYQIDDGVGLGIGYRFFRGPKIDNDVFVGKHDLPLDFDRDNHAVGLSLSFDLN